MQPTDDGALLRQYAENNSDEAFAALVTRHINLVYSVALRRVANPHHAEEITHAVFIILARKAASLRHDKALSSWLFQATRLTAGNFIRSEIRRHRREEEAYMQSVLNETATEVWPKIAPLLDDAVAGLREKDRQAIVLRFYEGRNLREVGLALGASEAAAEKRVNRALEKLRKFFTKRGVSSTTAIIAGTISANSVHAAPVTLAKSVTVVAIAKGAAASGSTLTLIKGALKIMAWTKAKTAIVASAIILLAAGTTTVTVKEIQEHKKYPWEVPTANFGTFYKMPPMVKIVPTKFVEDGQSCSDGSRGAMGICQPLKEIIQIAYQKDKLRTVVITDLPSDKYDFFAKLVPAQEPHKVTPQNENWTAALQNEIVKKFGIRGRIEMRATDVFLLKPSNTGVRGFKISHTMPKGHAMTGEPGNFACFEQPTSTLIGVLEHEFQLPIVDQTGLTAAYDYALKWNEPDRKQPNPDDLKRALLDQLGLELVPTNMPIEMLVVEKAQ